MTKNNTRMILNFKQHYKINADFQIKEGNFPYIKALTENLENC